MTTWRMYREILCVKSGYRFVVGFRFVVKHLFVEIFMH